MALMGFREYARHRGVALKTVQRAVESGRISQVVGKKGEKKIDSKKADREWDSNTDVSKVPAAYAEKVEEFARKLKPIDRTPDNIDDEIPDVEDFESEDDFLADDEKTPDFMKARARREEYMARIKEIEYRKLSGSLVAVEAVNKSLFKLARIVRDSMLSLPAKISHKLASETDAHAVSILLEKELRRALEELTHERLRKRSSGSD